MVGESDEAAVTTVGASLSADPDAVEVPGFERELREVMGAAGVALRDEHEVGLGGVVVDEGVVGDAEGAVGLRLDVGAEGAQRLGDHRLRDAGADTADTGATFTDSKDHGGIVPSRPADATPAPAIFPNPFTVDEALDRVRAWLEQPSAVIVESTRRHLAVLGGLLGSVGAGGNLVSDAHLAALALEHGATVISYDNDFDRFAGVRWERPAA